MNFIFQLKNMNVKIKKEREFFVEKNIISISFHENICKYCERVFGAMGGHANTAQSYVKIRAHTA